MSPLASTLEDYLRIRRQLGFKLEQEGGMLAEFVAFLEQAGAQRSRPSSRSRGQAAGSRAPASTGVGGSRSVRGFARYLATLDPASEVPSVDLLPAQQHAVAPYIYTDAEIAALMAAAGTLSPPLRAATFRTLIGLLACTGLRLGEALGAGPRRRRPRPTAC